MTQVVYQKNLLVIGCQWFYRMAWLNLLLIVFSLLGLGLFGFYPAVKTAVYALNRYFDGEINMTFAHFFHHWKSRLMSDNLAFIPFLILVFSLLWYAYELIINQQGFLAIVGLSLLPLTALVGFIFIASTITTAIEQTSNDCLFSRTLESSITQPSIPFTVCGIAMVSFIFYLLLPILGLLFSIIPALLAGVIMYKIKNNN